MTARGGALSALFLVGLAAPASTAAQTVAVHVRHAGSGQPVVGALVAMENEAGGVVGRALTDERGRALFFHFGLGPHRVRAEMIGMTSAASDVFEAITGARRELELLLESRPIRLDGLDVRTEERCGAPRGDGLLTARLWDEARKALTAASIAEEQGLYRYQTMLYEQDLDRDLRLVARSRQSRREANMRTPFRSRPVAELMERGFVEHSGMIDVYLAPDADVLLSDEFLDAHCFRARAGASRGETEDLVGLAFEPTSARRRLPEVAGTLWLDPGTAELQWLEYRYVNIDPELRLDEVGGRVEFRRMPDGGWIVPEWWIRMPRVSLQRTIEGDARRQYVAGFTEAGGVVLDVQGPGRILGHDVTGALEGVVRDSAGAPLPGISVELTGAERRVVTDSAGAFSFDDILEGVYELRVTSPELARLGASPTTVTRAVFNGEVTSTELALPSAPTVLRASCRDALRPEEWEELAGAMPASGIVFGWVTGPRGAPAPDVRIRLLTPTIAFRPGRSAATSSGRPAVAIGNVDLTRSELVTVQGSVGLETRTNERGFYRFCGVPERQRLLLDLLPPSADSGWEELRLEAFSVEEAGGRVEQSIRLPGAGRLSPSATPPAAGAPPRR
jgi:hypothetical protein